MTSSQQHLRPAAAPLDPPSTGKVWITNGFWAVLDQALFAATNFVLNVFMARWLDPEAYGAYSVAYSLYLLLATFHTALLTEPMLVYGPTVEREVQGPYLRALVQAHVVFALGLSAILGAIALLFWSVGNVALTKAFLGLAAGGSFMILLWFGRRAWYLRLAPRVAALSGAAYLVAVLGTAALLRGARELDVFTILLVMGGVAAIVDWFLLRTIVSRPLAAGIAEFADLFRPHLRYGRWALPTSALTWVPGNLPYVVLSIWAGLDASAELRVAITLAMPMIQTNYAIGQLLLPTFSRERKRVDFRQLVRRTFVYVVGLALAFWAALSLLGRPVLSWLYAGSYPDVARYLVWIGLYPVLNGIVGVQQSLLRAYDRPRAVFWAYLTASLATVLIGMPLTYALGLGGAIAAVILSYTALAVALGWNLK